MDLRDFTKKLNEGNSIPFMEGRTKGELTELVDKNVTLRDFAFLRNDEGEYAVFVVDEIQDSFYFGGMVITENLKLLENEGYKEDIKNNGLPVKVFSRKSKNKKNYYGFIFCPEG